MKVNRKRLIKFYDEKLTDRGRGSDVSAITGLWGEDLLLGVLQHYWNTREGAKSTILPCTCSTGQKKGPRLDAWIVKHHPVGGDSLFQVEVKNWAAYSLGEQPLDLNASDEKVADYSERQWDYYLSDEFLLSKWGPKVLKVLTPMKRPKSFEARDAIALVCFWFCISDSRGEAFSTHRYPDERQINVFSASLYLRSLTEELIEIPMPRAERRLRVLGELIADDPCKAIISALVGQKEPVHTATGLFSA